MSDKFEYCKYCVNKDSDKCMKCKERKIYGNNWFPSKFKMISMIEEFVSYNKEKFNGYCNDCFNNNTNLCKTCEYDKIYNLDEGDFVYTTIIPSNFKDSNCKSEDKVNHPNHYKSETGLETIEVIEAFCFDLQGIECVCTANILKYVCRWKKKNGLEDLKKAKWYLEKLINQVEKMEEENK